MSLFEKIARGEIPSFKIAEDEKHFAFLDIRPVQEGHTLVIPKKAVDPVFALSPENFKDLFAFSQKVAVLLKEKLRCERVCMAVLGYEVPHAHIHLIPTNEAREFPWPSNPQASADVLAQIQKHILGS